ncbi:MAG TPA: cobaltochelatase subunit CobN [Kofleriaceae bacterium]|nr:cobaltochelatase subunit CobN [Kofleriaceae bacterium]
MSARRRTGRVVAVVLGLVACALGALAACRSSERPEPPGEVVFIGIWDATKPMMEQMSAALRMRIRAFTPADSQNPDFAARIGAPKLLFVLNAPVEQTALYEQIVRTAKAAGSRVFSLDSRDWQAAMIKSGVLETDPMVTRYWRYSGTRNVRNMLQYINVAMLGHLAPIIPPAPTPTDGVWHPDASDTFDTVALYDAWYLPRRKLPADAPKVAYIIHSSFINLDETADTAAVVRALEKRGLLVYVLFSDTEEKLRKTLVDLHPTLVMTQRHTGLGKPADGSTPIPELLDVAYLKPIGALNTSVDEWQHRPEGLQPGDIANQIVAQELEGTIEPLIISAQANAGEYRTQYPIDERVEHFADRAASWVKLSRTANPDKRLAIIYYNVELGGDGLAKGSASGMFLDGPESLVRFTRALAADGYKVTPPADAPSLIARMAATGRNFGPWAQEDIDKMAASGEAVLIKASVYAKWFDEHMTDREREMVIHDYGPPPGKLMVTSIHGEPEIVIPRVNLGDGVSLFPQPEKGGRQDTKVIHDPNIPPSHQYLAFYLWLQEVYKPHALVHFGTHGTLELLPKRAAGLGPDDFADTLLGSMPNINPWILDNVAEATLARRRAYAVLVDHLVPPIERTVVNEALHRLHEDAEKAHGLEPGPVKEAFRKRIAETMKAEAYGGDLLPKDGSPITDDGLAELNSRLEELEEEQAPRTLHVLGQVPPDDRRPDYIAAILGREAQARAGGRPALTALVGCALAAADDTATAACSMKAKPAVSGQVVADLLRARKIEGDLQKTPDELGHLLHALDGKYVPPGPGNDPVRNPAAIPTGRDMYALDPESIPTEPAMDVARMISDQIIAEHQKKHGAMPHKIAINLNGFETMRDTGVTEAEVLALVGAEPVRDDRGRVTDVALIPRAKLGRPRVDVVLAISGAYRDNFATRIKLLDKAIRLAQDAADEPDNVLAADTRNEAAALTAKGMSADEAARVARLRIFGSPPGQYGTQILHLVPRSGAWNDRAEIAQVYRENMHFAYGEQAWGEPTDEAFGAAMSDVDAVSHVWASNMMSPLTNHHVYEYLGGLTLAVEQASGKQPDAIVADVRDPDNPRARDLAEVVSTESAVRLLNQQWIKDMKSNGYAGGGHVSAYTENLFGWATTVPGSVDPQLFAKVDQMYLQDADNRAWLEKDNPDALLDMTATLLESARRGYYQPSADAKERLVADYMQQVARRGPPTGLMGGGNESLAEYVRKASDDATSKIDRAVVAAYQARMAEANKAAAAAAQSLAQAQARTPPPPSRPKAAPEVEGVKMQQVVEAREPPRTVLWIVSGAGASIALGNLLAGLVFLRPRPRRRDPEDV